MAFENDGTTLYKYSASKAAAYVFGIIFIILTLGQAWRIFRTRKWFGLAIFAGGVFEIVGLFGRVESISKPTSIGFYALQMLPILLAPILFAASVYMFLGRLIRASQHPAFAIIRVTWLTKIFVASDILCFLVQGGGAGILVNAKTTSRINTAQDIITGGLALQIIVFGLYLLSAVTFHLRILRQKLLPRLNPNLRLNLMMCTLYIASALITIRNIYRLVEYKTGQGGYVQTHEWPMYAFDVGLMAVIMGMTALWYSADLRQDFEELGGMRMNEV